MKKVHIIGGGIIGMSIAYHLSDEAEVVVFEKDTSYADASFARSCGGFRSQFTTETNIQMSRFSTDFIRGETDVDWTPNGYLMLFNNAQREEARKSFDLQRRLGADTVFLEDFELDKRFPYVDSSRFSCGVASMKGQEGWVDPTELHKWFKTAAVARGVTIKKQDGLRVDHDDADAIVIAAGWKSGEVADNWGIKVPVKGHKHTVFNVSTEREVISNMPLVADMEGLIYLRPEGNGYIIGSELNGEWNSDDLEPNWNSWETIWEAAYNLMPNVFDTARMEGAWAGYYDASTLDNNAIIDNVGRFYIASGFTGRGLMHSPSVGLAVSEMVLDKDPTFDLSSYSLNREPNAEQYVI